MIIEVTLSHTAVQLNGIKQAVLRYSDDMRVTRTHFGHNLIGQLTALLCSAVLYLVWCGMVWQMSIYIAQLSQKSLMR